MKLFPLIFVIVFILVACNAKEKSPCFKEAGVSNCSELFDLYQANLNDPMRSITLKDCYDEQCQ